MLRPRYTVTKMGWLNWRESDWRLDYYMLVREPPSLNGFREPTSPSRIPAFSLSLENVLSIQRAVHIDSTRREFAFDLTFSDSIVLQFAVNSESELYEWLQALAAVIYVPRTRHIPSKTLQLPAGSELTSDNDESPNQVNDDFNSPSSKRKMRSGPRSMLNQSKSIRRILPAKSKRESNNTGGFQ